MADSFHGLQKTAADLLVLVPGSYRTILLQGEFCISHSVPRRRQAPGISKVMEGVLLEGDRASRDGALVVVLHYTVLRALATSGESPESRRQRPTCSIAHMIDLTKSHQIPLFADDNEAILVLIAVSAPIS